MVRNEQDIIEPFLRHNSQFFDAMILLDNGSADRTRAIAQQVARELGSIFLTDLRHKAYDQGAIFSRALAFVQGAFFADVVMFLDADEFLIAPSAGHFHKALDAVVPGTAARLPWRTFLPDPDADPDEPCDVLTRIRWRRVRERPSFSKVALRLGGSADLNVKVAQGAHQAFGPDGKELTLHGLPPDFYIAHLPVRSRNQMLAKGVIGWRANLARPDRKRGQAAQWRRLHDIYFDKGEAATKIDLSNEALIYAQRKPYKDWNSNAKREAPPILGLRRYSDGTSEAPELLIASSETPGDHHPARHRIAARNPASPGARSEIDSAFDAGWHWRKLFLDIPPFANLYETEQPQSVLDVGCGHGLYLDIARQCGASEILGIDGMDRSGTALAEGEYLKLDLQKKHALGRTFDLVLCLEVVEHVHPEATGVVFDFLADHAAGTVLFSMAEPGQPGNGHINCRRMDEVLQFWRERGWWPDLAATLGFRSLATLSWFRRNVVVLRKERSEGSEAATEALQLIAARRYRWYGQAPAIRLGVFEEDPPGPKHGYVSARGG
jgi:SAM-dependent methyltransferase/glycosyltransferase involved in cell wall biosynthesis